MFSDNLGILFNNRLSHLNFRGLQAVIFNQYHRIDCKLSVYIPFYYMNMNRLVARVMDVMPFFTI